jgi:hypothetical protein
MFWSGDNHNHWHVKDLEHYALFRYDPNNPAPATYDNPAINPASAKLSTGAKQGFCFYDNQGPLSGYTTTKAYDSPPACNPAQYDSSGNQIAGTGTSATDVPMGLQVGWGDLYGSSLSGQYVDLTDSKGNSLPAGKYTLYAKADPKGLFTESKTSNNLTWVNIEIGQRKNHRWYVTVLGSGGYVAS